MDVDLEHHSSEGKELEVPERDADDELVENRRNYEDEDGRRLEDQQELTREIPTEDATITDFLHPRVVKGM